jgi:hypothetical protein
VNRVAPLMIAAAFAAMLVVLFIVAGEHSPAEAAVWYTAIAAAVAVLALLSAGLFAWPEFVDRVVRKPQMKISLLTRTDSRDDFEPVLGDERRLTLQGTSVELEARIVNEGKAPLRWAMLNIQIPFGLKARVTDPPEKHHYVNPHGGYSGDLWPGSDMRCFFSVAEREFLPPHTFLYHVQVVLPRRRGVWPIAAVLEGGRPYRRHVDRIELVRS